MEIPTDYESYLKQFSEAAYIASQQRAGRFHPAPIPKIQKTLIEMYTKKNACGETWVPNLSRNYETADEYLKATLIDPFTQGGYINLAIGGASATGKSFVVDKFGRNPKINNYLPSVKQKFYNMLSVVSLEYFIKCIFSDASAWGMVRDRTCIDNLAWALAEEYGSYESPHLTTAGKLHILFSTRNVAKILEYACSQTFNVILINTANPTQAVIDRAKKDGHPGVLFRLATSRGYENVQVVYAMLARLLGWPCIDYSYLMDAYNLEYEEARKKVQDVLIQIGNEIEKLPYVPPNIGVGNDVDQQFINDDFSKMEFTTR